MATIPKPVVPASDWCENNPLLTPQQVAERLNTSLDWVWDYSSRKMPLLPVILIEFRQFLDSQVPIEQGAWSFVVDAQTGQVWFGFAETLLCSGWRMTRHPRMGAAEQLSVNERELEESKAAKGKIPSIG
jgi:hypothetical protein